MAFEFDAAFWATVALVIFVGVIVYLKVPGMLGKALDSRIKAIETASEIGLVATGAALSINFIPGAVYRPETCTSGPPWRRREGSVSLPRS